MNTNNDSEWNEKVSQEIRRRIAVTAKISANERYREITKRAIANSGTGLQIFVSDYVWTYDPRNQNDTPKDLPFILWPKQVEFLEWIKNLESIQDNGVVDKSRDVGVTWLVAAYYVWRWLTVPGWSGAIGSRKADILDRLNDPKSIFWKLEYIIRMLPDWLRPNGFDMRVHRNYARIINPEMRSSITGEAGPEMGRGGRSSFYFLDEFGVMPRAAQVRAAVADNARTVLFASTATGPDTEFYKIVHEENISHFRISWQDDPRKDEKWRDNYLRLNGPLITAREVDIDYSGGANDVIIPNDWIRAAIELDFGTDKNVRPIIGFDVADSGDNESVIVIRRGPAVVSLESWRGRDPVASAAIVAERAQSTKTSIVRFDSIGVGAGVTGAFSARNDLGFSAVGVNTGIAASTVTYSDAPDRTARQRFLNLKAEIWWNLRLRFWNTWRYVNGEASDINPEDCISIPNDPKLIAQLSVPRIQTNERGLLKVESKDSLRRRGMSSPDRADALVLAFADSINGIFNSVSVHGQVISTSEHLHKARLSVEGSNGRAAQQYQKR